MKRSEVNRAIKKAEAFLKEQNFFLPPFAGWTPEDWAEKGRECDEIRDNMLGWDITDFGRNDFSRLGLTLFTIRNGNQHKKEKYPKVYAEKILITEEGQICPMHFHFNKSEDIINRGGGILVMKLYNSTAEGGLADTDVAVSSDGIVCTVPAGYEMELLPGQSVTLTTGLYHAFWSKPGHGTVLIGEVSECNDDNTDNRFYEDIGRFSAIEEDELPYRLLCTEYPAK
ncbi:D-lyxose/D-mannose family sugar isomerase [Treponema sp. OttesenSCG-928-L16]|nr:D-lyxose/D-mannose family sugar isomerase [Treponema sp. OttesenSCG-928-L16]